MVCVGSNCTRTLFRNIWQLFLISKFACIGICTFFVQLKLGHVQGSQSNGFYSPYNSTRKHLLHYDKTPITCYSEEGRRGQEMAQDG